MRLTNGTAPEWRLSRSVPGGSDISRALRLGQLRRGMVFGQHRADPQNPSIDGSLNNADGALDHGHTSPDRRSHPDQFRDSAKPRQDEDSLFWRREMLTLHRALLERDRRQD